jgi:putative membrane protein
MADREPDYRFTLANERTFLAWIRTALGLLAAGVAMRQLVPAFDLPGATAVLAVGCAVMAVVLAAASYPRWRSVQRAIRADAPLPRTRLIAALAMGVLALALLTTVAVIVG